MDNESVDRAGRVDGLRKRRCAHCPVVGVEEDALIALAPEVRAQRQGFAVDVTLLEPQLVHGRRVQQDTPPVHASQRRHGVCASFRKRSSTGELNQTSPRSSVRMLPQRCARSATPKMHG